MGLEVDTEMPHDLLHFPSASVMTQGQTDFLLTHQNGSNLFFCV